LAWEYRGIVPFYYRSRRVNGLVVREYVGGGEKGHLAAEADQAAREARRQVERLRAGRWRPVQDLTTHVRQFESVLETLVVCQLMSAGWRQIHRQWKAPNRWH